MPTQSEDINSLNGPALEFTLLDETWIIDPGVTVYSRDDDAVANLNPQLEGSTLINNGNVVGDNSGAYFTGENAAVTNNAGGTIIGASVGVAFKGGGIVTNHGMIGNYQELGVFFDTDATNATVTNTGEIYGRDAAVVVSSTLVAGSFNNSGMIRSDGVGVAFNSTSGEVTTINNAKGGTIAGGAGNGQVPGAAIFSIEGRVDLTNKGMINGDIMLTAATGNVDDKIVNMGKILGDIHLGDGNDVFIGNKGKKVVLFGEGDDDKLVASRGRDKLDGGDGNDVLIGQRNKDFQTGGSGADRFDFNSIKDSLKGGKRDKILDFDSSEDDMIDLRGIDAKMGMSGNQKFKWIGKQGFHDKEGELRYVKKGASAVVEGDVNGDGKADFQIQLQDVGASHKGDFIL